MYKNIIITLGNIVGKACSPCSASKSDLSVGSDRTFTPIVMAERRTGEAARKDRLGNRLRHAENYADAVIPYNFAAS